ncbi:MAG: hypothetical protein AB8E74_11000 [Prochlorococcus sp.]
MSADETNESTQGQPPQVQSHCGSKPKRIAIGIAPLGTISIGIVPMGVVCIGVVPMGVVSIGVVGMGIINAAVVGMGLLAVGVSTMGVWTAGPISMGLIDLNRPAGQSAHQHHGHHTKAADSPGPGLPQMGPLEDAALDPRFSAYETREEALAAASEIGCEGVHQMGTHWMACDQHSDH